MEIRITDEALKFAADRNAECIMIRRMTVGGCAGHYNYAVAFAGNTPEGEDALKFKKYEGGQLPVYIFKGGSIGREGLDIYVSSEMRGVEGLELKGLEYQHGYFD